MTEHRYGRQAGQWAGEVGANKAQIFWGEKHCPFTHNSPERGYDKPKTFDGNIIDSLGLQETFICTQILPYHPAFPQFGK